MVVASAVVAGGAVAAGDPGGEARVDQGFERVVNGGEADSWDALLDGAIDFVGRGMRFDAGEIFPDFAALSRCSGNRPLGGRSALRRARVRSVARALARCGGWERRFVSSSQL